MTKEEIEALPLADRQFLALKEEFLDLYAALEAVRQSAEERGVMPPPNNPVGRAHDALRAKIVSICNPTPDELKIIGLG